MVLIYQPSEDSYLLQFVIKDFEIKKNSKCLDMGSGSGIQAETLISKGIAQKNLTLIDVNTEAIRLLKKKFKDSNVIESNLFSNPKIKKEKFDLIIFNPPYLPENPNEDKESQIATTGGKEGSEIINKFLKQSKKHLEKDGRILLLTSSLTKGIIWNGYKKKLLAEKKLFMEKLKVWNISPKDI